MFKFFLINHEAYTMELEFKGIRLWDFWEKKKIRSKPFAKKQLLNYFLRDWYFQFYHESFQTEPGYESNLRPPKSVRLALKIIVHSVSFELALSIIPLG